MKFSAGFIVILCHLSIVIVSIEAQVPFFGGCPTKSVIKDFDPQAYLGRWYEIEKYNSIFERDGTCIESYYSDRGNGTVGIATTQVRKNGKIRSIMGTATPIESAKYSVSFDDLPLLSDSPYWILDTDYKNYSIIWSCSDFGLMNFQVVYFMGREREPSRDVRALVYDKMDENGIRRDLLEKTNQINCKSST